MQLSRKERRPECLRQVNMRDVLGSLRRGVEVPVGRAAAAMHGLGACRREAVAPVHPPPARPVNARLPHATASLPTSLHRRVSKRSRSSRVARTCLSIVSAADSQCPTLQTAALPSTMLPH